MNHRKNPYFMKQFNLSLLTLLVMLFGGPFLFGQPFMMKMSSTSGQIGQTVCLDVQVFGGHEVLALQHSITYDTEVLAFSSVEGFNLPDMNISNFGTPESDFIPDGTITMSWFNPENELVFVEDGSSIYQVCFNIIGQMNTAGEVVFTDSPTPFEVISTDDVNLNVSYAGGQVRVGSTPALAITDCDVITIDCQDTNLGGINMVISGGTPPYLYIWTGPNGFSSNEQNLNTLQPGAYAVTIIDSDNTSLTALFHLNEESSSFITNVEITNVSCGGGADGAIDLTLSDAFTYQYNWSNGATTQDVTGLAPGDYTVSVFNSETGCVSIESYIVEQSEDIVAGVNFECVEENGQMIATLNVLVWGGGTPPYIFSLNGVTVQSDDLASFNVAPNNDYNVTITDLNGCTTTVHTEVNCDFPEPDVFTLFVNNQTVEAGDYFCVPIIANNFTNIAAFQFTLQWDDDVLHFENVNDESLLENVEFGNMDEAIEQGYLRCAWATPNVLMGETFPDGTVIGELCFTAIGDSGASTFMQFVDQPLSIEAIGTNLEETSINTNAGIISIFGNQGGDGNLFVASEELALPGQPVCVDVSVNDFNNILSFQYSMAWDPAVVTYESVVVTDALEGLTSTNFGDSQIGEGFLSVSWLDPGAINGISIPNETVLYSVCFTATGVEGSTSPFVFTDTPTAIEVFAADDIIIPFTSQPGAIIIDGQGFVWPGDTDDDLAANQFDLLNIGLGYGRTGPHRTDQSLDWSAHAAEDWNFSTPISNIDYKNADTDGNGVINADDTLGIIINWGESVNFAPNNEDDFHNNFDGRMLQSPFYVFPDTVNAGDMVALPIILGDEANPAEDLYGIAFSILYDTEAVVPESAWLSFENSWLGAINDDMISIERDFPEEGRIDIAITRIDGTNRLGAGTLAILNITIEDVIFRGPEYPLRFAITNVKAISNSEELLVIESQETTGVILDDETNTINPELDQFIQIIPNPVSDHFNIRTQNVQLQQLKLYNATGQLVAIHEADSTVSTEHLPSGVYLVQILTNKGVVSKKVVKQ